MNKLSNTDEFLENMFLILQQNPDIVLDNNFIYSNMVNDSKNENIRMSFDKWIEEFENTNNIDVFVSPQHPYWCQFTNGSLGKYHTDQIKMYLSYDADVVYENAKMIFEFLAKNNIAHSSKIGAKTRKDNVVIRVTNIKDSQKLADFINSNELLHTKNRKRLDFTFNEDNISYATDGMLSFNEETSKKIVHYISAKDLSKSISENQISTVDFKEFLIKSISDITLENPNRELLNTVEIIDMLIKFLDENYTLENYYQDFEERKISKLENDNYFLALSLNKILSQYKNIDLNSEYIFNELNNSKEKFLSKYASVVLTNITKYGYPHTVNAFNNFIQNGITDNFTRDNGSRDYMNLINNNVFINEINNVYKAGEFSCSNFCIETAEHLFNEFSKAVLLTEKKYGYGQTIYAIEKLLVENTLQGFTNEENSRSNLKSLGISSDVLKTIIFYKNYRPDKVCYTVEDIIDLTYTLCKENNPVMKK